MIAAPALGPLAPAAKADLVSEARRRFDDTSATEAAPDDATSVQRPGLGGGVAGTLAGPPLPLTSAESATSVYDPAPAPAVPPVTP